MLIPEEGGLYDITEVINESRYENVNFIKNFVKNISSPSMSIGLNSKEYI